jgi:hypothetical protein
MMPALPTTISEFRVWAASQGWLTADAAATLDGESLPALLDQLQAAGTITAEQRNLFANDPPSTESIVLSEEPMPLLSVPAGHDDNPYVPESAETPGMIFTNSAANPASPPVRRVADKPMTREQMWTWIGVGGGLWMLGLIILGVWLGGCLNEAPKPRPKAKVSQTK